MVVVLLAVACAGPQAGVQPTVTTTTLAQSRNEYFYGLKSLVQADYPKAMAHLQKVARGPSYIVYSPLARIRIADALFYQQQYEEAVEAYRAFIETNAGDPNVHYAYYRMAESKVKSIAGDFFLVPPADRRDQKRVRSSLRSLTRFIEAFPNSPYVNRVIEMSGNMARTAASFEMEVARFYMSRNKPIGAANRLIRLMEDVPAAREIEDANVQMIEALSESGRVDDLLKECGEYARRFPSGKLRDKVKSVCSEARDKADDKEAELKG